MLRASVRDTLTFDWTGLAVGFGSIRALAVLPYVRWRMLWMFVVLWPLPTRAFEYDLFHPVPTASLRPYDPDRPGFNDSPRTIDAGHVRIESAMLSYSRSDTDSYSVGGIEAGLGIFPALEIQAAFDGATWRSDGASGAGDVTMRAKLALHGNNARGPAVGLIPSVKIPSGALGNHKIEEGFRVPLGYSAPEGTSFSLMPEWDQRRNGSGTGTHAEYSLAGQVSQGLAKGWLGFLQYGFTASTEPGQGANASVGGGATYRICPSTQLDAGLNFGVSDAAPKVAASTGLAFRF